MIKVLDKTFAVLEAIIGDSAYNPRRVNELAHECGINTATCARILKELTDAGYLTHLSRNEGYTAGPRAEVFASLTFYQPKRMRAVRAAVDAASAQYEASVLYAELHGTEKYILYHRNGSKKLHVRLRAFGRKDHFQTATGLVLAAYSSPEIRKILAAESMRAGDDLYEAGTDPETLLARVRAEEGFVHTKEHEGQGIMAFPVLENGYVTGALGASAEIGYFENAEKARILIDGIRAAARHISNEISYRERIG